MAFEMARALSHERAHFAPRMSERLNALMAEGMAIHGDTHAAGLLQTLAWRGRMDALFDRHDVLITPSATGEAPAGLGATGDPMFCRSWSLLGLPCVHLPVAQSQHGLPIGLQLVGRHGQDHQLLAVAQWVHERLTR
jgi:Asp-tRNA(Asn)/Glu-tRNA(Gln) amidotransferase A subunit family amidase